MKWVTIDNIHLNAGAIEGFYWTEGSLYLRLISSDANLVRKDPDRKKYLRICAALGVRPVGEDDEDG